jgi:hypothetical protein
LKAEDIRRKTKRRTTMKSFNLRTASLAAVVFASVCATPAGAHCVSRLSQLRAATMYAPQAMPPLQAASVEDSNGQAADPSITGYWYVRFEADGKLFDDGFDVWTSDGTEILNDTTPPSAGAVCLGVWTKTGRFTYTLKHPSWIFDDAGVNLIAIVIIREQVVLDRKGQGFSGNASFDVYDLSGNQLDHGATSLTGVRMAALDDTSATGGIPGLPPSILRR